jgi:hypothetical protein
MVSIDKYLWNSVLALAAHDIFFDVFRRLRCGYIVQLVISDYHGGGLLYKPGFYPKM